MDVKRRKRGEEEKQSAISKLPEELICHILSFLSTKEAALTSVLSKSWRNLFILLPSLDLDDSLFVPGDRPEECERTSFVEFVNRVLALQSNSPITKFSLVCHKGVDQHADNEWIVNEWIVNEWIVKALRRGATDLTLMWLFPPRLYSLAPNIYIHGQNLIKLKLGRGELGLFTHSLFRTDFTFAKLRTLHLDFHSPGFGSQIGSSFALLLSKCPVLEELIVNCMKWHKWKLDASVSSSTLKRLSIDSESYHFTALPSLITSDINVVYPTLNPQYISFDTPNLLYLNYTDFLARNYPLVKLDSLVEARLDVGLTSFQMRTRDSDELEVRWDATNLIMGIHNVRTLELTSATLEVISDFCKTIPVFNKLNYLSIESNADHGWQALPLFLVNCPNLHTLVFSQGLHHCVTDGCGDVCDCMSPSLATSSLSLCPVKVLKILDFGATCAEMSLLEHFLKTMPQLEQVIIVLNLESAQAEDLDMLKVSSALEMAPRASTKCNLKVVT